MRRSARTYTLNVRLLKYKTRLHASHGESFTPPFLSSKQTSLFSLIRDFGSTRETAPRPQSHHYDMMYPFLAVNHKIARGYLPVVECQLEISDHCRRWPDLPNDIRM